jgi:hypothetical protein
MSSRSIGSVSISSLVILAIVLGLLALGVGQGDATPSTMVPVTFFNHIQAGMNEQDVFIERTAGSDEVYRVTLADTDLTAMLYTSAAPTEHNPLDADDIGPFPKGQALDVTLGEWLDAAGQAVVTCEGDEGSLRASFERLVPGGVYTLWHFFMAMPATIPFSTYDLPLGERDGSQSVFVADADGRATHEVSFSPCIQMSGEQLIGAFAVAYHSDGRTYGSSPGSFGDISHLQLLAFLPSYQEVAAR